MQNAGTAHIVEHIMNICIREMILLSAIRPIITLPMISEAPIRDTDSAIVSLSKPRVLICPGKITLLETELPICKQTDVT